MHRSLPRQPYPDESSYLIFADTSIATLNPVGELERQPVMRININHSLSASYSN